MRRRDERARVSVMLFMRGGGGVSVEEAPMSRCKVPLQGIIHGGFGLKGVKVFVCRTSHSHPRRECVLPRSLSIPRQGSTVVPHCTWCRTITQRLFLVSARAPTTGGTEMIRVLIIFKKLYILYLPSLIFNMLRTQLRRTNFNLSVIDV